MKQFIVCLVMILLLSLLVGCSRGKNVSDSTDGSITDNTTDTTRPVETTTRPTETTTRPTETTTQESSTSEDIVDDIARGIAPRGMLGGERY